MFVFVPQRSRLLYYTIQLELQLMTILNDNYSYMFAVNGVTYFCSKSDLKYHSVLTNSSCVTGVICGVGSHAIINDNGMISDWSM